MAVKRVLITGASKGIGREVAKYLAAQAHYQVIGTGRNVDRIRDKIEGVRYVNLDLCNESSIYACIKEVGDIDVLINNAGMAQIGSVEEVSMDKLKQIFEANFFGSVRLMKALGKEMRLRRDGHIINITSLVDKISVPYLSGYTASKTALAGFTQAYRMELMEFGVKVCTISPADVKTEMRADLILPENSVYEKKVLKMEAGMYKNMEAAPGPIIIAKLIEKILKTKKPKPVYNVGNMVGPIMFLKRTLSDKALEKLLKMIYGI
ncbi:MAG: SDR family oxidoreductase [Bacteroidetes bacterium]|nr:SDR family oxidoreductase [Bacteroidota bacterium]